MPGLKSYLCLRYKFFVDLKKAFDSVDRGVLFDLLEQKCGVPVGIVSAIRKLHQGMKTRAWHGGQLGESFEMSTGVRQGSIEGSILANLYIGYTVRDVPHRCPRSGIKLSPRRAVG